MGHGTLTVTIRERRCAIKGQDLNGTLEDDAHKSCRQQKDRLRFCFLPLTRRHSRKSDSWSSKTSNLVLNVYIARQETDRLNGDTVIKAHKHSFRKATPLVIIQTSEWLHIWHINLSVRNEKRPPDHKSLPRWIFTPFRNRLHELKLGVLIKSGSCYETTQWVANCTSSDRCEGKERKVGN